MIWAKVLSFVKGIPDVAWWIILAVCTATFIDLRARSEQRKEDKAKRVDEARKVDNQILENSDEMVAQADRIRAANPVEPDAPDGVPREPIARYHYRDR